MSASAMTQNEMPALLRLNRTFTTQIEALASLRRGGRQKMTVKHVHVYPGGQAIVGDVTHTPRRLPQ
jgi:hypothetical protein